MSRTEHVLPLRLAIDSPRRWVESDPNHDPAKLGFQQARLEVIKRDSYRCAGCGFVSQPLPQPAAAADDESDQETETMAPDVGQVGPWEFGYMEVHHLGNIHSRTGPSDLFTVCPLCHEVFHAGLSSEMFDEPLGSIIVSAIPQGVINMITLLAGVAKSMGENERVPSGAESLYRAIEEAGNAERCEVMGPQWDGDPRMLQAYLIGAAGSHRKALDGCATELRYLPKLTGCPPHQRLFRSLQPVIPAQSFEDWRTLSVRIAAALDEAA